MLAQMIEEREKLDRAIGVLQALDAEQGKSSQGIRRRGRPLGSRNRVRQEVGG
jgi:hypothetical protein